MYSSPMDGSCFYHSFSYMLHPLMKDETPSPKAIKEMVKEFYKTSSGRLKESLEKLLCTTFQEGYRDVCRPNNWGQYDDALCLATIMRLSFYILTVDSIHSWRVLHREVVVGRRANGWRNLNTTGCERILIYFQTNAHYGIGVSI